MAGNDPRLAKVIADGRVVIAYLPNPDSEVPGKADAAATNAACRLQLPPGDWLLRWFNPQTGAWVDDPAPKAAGGDPPCARTAPFAGDAVLLAVIRTAP
jgi:hypothetical protein